MKAVSVAFVVLLVMCAGLMLYRSFCERQSQKCAEEARRHREAGKEKFERDQLQAAAMRERLQTMAVAHHEWPQQFSSVYNRLTANLPELPEPNLYPGHDVVPFHREVSEDDLSVPIEWTSDKTPA